MENTKRLGLRQRILKAKTVGEVHELMAEGKTYDHPSPGTVRRWERAAKARIDTIMNPPKAVAPNQPLSNSEKRRLNVEAGRHPNAGVKE